MLLFFIHPFFFFLSGAIQLNINLYNPSVNLFVTVLALFEFTAGGDIIPALRVRVYKRVNYDDHSTWVLLILDLCVLIFFIRYLSIEFYEFQNLWYIDDHEILLQNERFEQQENAYRRNRERGTTGSATNTHDDLSATINPSKCSRFKRVVMVYIKDLWNTIDLLTLFMYFISLGCKLDITFLLY